MDATTAMYVAQGLHGLAYGMILFLVASGLTLIFGMMGILTLAHAAFFMLSAYFSYQVMQMTQNFWLALLIAPVVAGIVGVLCERFLIRRVHVMGHIGELILTVGISLVILDAVKAIWSTDSLYVDIPECLQGLVSIVGMEYPIYRLFIIGLALLVLIFMALILYKTRLGMIVRAAVSDADMVNALGINVPLVFMLVFGVGTWMAGVAGVAIAPILTVFPGLADQMGMDAYIIVVVGGFGSLSGAFLVSIIFGLLSSYGVQFVSQLAPILMFIFMAIVLVIKPVGIFGERE
ncbi:MAG: branched-chain amino acid ABC transporter permease [Deltaproteobacteria bacterium]|nr:branched-chain amino acid ABC transporter permease [Deltaproteobacteria bacterium]MBW1812912.1 branched-chain amino acid ABC transporter permease [Deltaproteobacteria bacterium]MBW1847462.1 branched-chain amino acid ABC transporter permease [Deltaproteobacteria bacterium]MBW1983738.1 branched-chain amino acid ABC transporter permease [Deltaproteobacteria bacterium]MBW2179184.1 branched-chain amino acid ABC transporter permease [Deltaproteobacteria bacterium]